MKKYTKLLWLILASLFITNIAPAQKNGRQILPPIPDTNSIKEIVKNLSIELSLNKEQEEQISKLYFKQFEDVKNISEKTKYSNSKVRKEIELLNADFEQEVNFLLKEKQKKKYEIYVNKVKLHRRDQKPPKGGKH